MYEGKKEFHYNGAVYSKACECYKGVFHAKTIAASRKEAYRKLQYIAKLKFGEWVDFVEPIFVKEGVKIVRASSADSTHSNSAEQMKINF